MSRPKCYLSLCNSTITKGGYNFKQTSFNCINNSIECAKTCENFMSTFPENGNENKDT